MNKLFSKLFFVLFMIFSMSTVFAATASVTWHVGWVGVWTGVGQQPAFRISISDCGAGGYCWCNAQINGGYATMYDSGEGYMDYKRETLAGHTSRAIGEVPIQVNCCDGDGSASWETNCTTVTSTTNSSPGIDTAGPVSTSITINDTSGFTNDSIPSLTLSATDAYSGLKEMAFSCNNSDWTSWIEYNTSYSSFNMISSTGCSGSDGTKTIYVKFRDNLDQESSSTSDSTYYDTTAPTVSSITLSDYSLKAGQEATVSFSFYDVSGAVSSFTASDVTYPNGSLSAVSGSGLSYTATFTANAIHDESNVISVGTSWTDLVGNSASVGGSSANYTITPPYASSGTYNANEGSRVLTISFDEIMDASATDLSKIHVRGAGQSSGGVTLTGATVTNSDSTTLTITTTEAQRILIKELANTYGVANLEIDLDAEAVQELDLSFPNEADTDNDITYTTDTTKPLISLLSVNDSMLTESDVGSGEFIVTIDFSEAMDTDVDPQIVFQPLVTSTLTCAGVWSDANTYTYTCDVADADIDLDDIDVKVTNALDIYTNNKMLADTESDKFSIDTVKPVIDSFVVSNSWVSDNNVGNSGFYFDITFDGTMTTSTKPGIEFIPDVSDTLACSGSWSSSVVYRYTCDVIDANVYYEDVNVRITNGIDAVGNKMTTDIEVDHFGIDTIKPIISVSNNASESWVNQDTISVTVSDSSSSGISVTNWAITSNTTCDGTVTFTQEGTDVNANNEDTYYNKYICFKTTDNAGNISYVVSSQIAKLDTSNPTTSGAVSKAPDGLNDWYITDLNYVITPSGDRSGVLDTNYCVDTNNECIPDTNYSAPITLHNDGNNYVRFRSLDNAGNLQTTVSSGLIKIDQTAPTVGETTLSGFSIDVNQIWGVGTIVGGSATDATSDINTSSCEYDANIDGTPSWGTASWSEGNCEKTNFTIESGKTYIFNTRVKDLAGNTGTGTVTIQYVADNVAPIVDLNSNLGSDWINSDFNIIFDVNYTVSDLNSAIYMVIWPDDSNTTGSFDSTNTAQPYLLVDVTDYNQDGVYTLDYNFIDNAGNYTAGDLNFYIDLTNPTTSGDINSGTQGDNNIYISDVNFVLESSDVTSDINYTLYCIDSDGSCTPDTNYTGIIVVSDDGNNYVRFRSVDNAGNFEDINTSDLIKMDQTEPVISFTGNATTYTITLNVSSNDDVNCRYDSNTLKTFDEMETSIDSNLITSYSWPTITGLTASTTYTYLVQCRNLAGLDSNSLLSVTTSAYSSGSRNTGGGGSSSSGISTIVISDTTESVDTNTDDFRDFLESIKNDSNNSLYKVGEIDNIISNLGDYEFTRNVLVEKRVYSTKTLYDVTVTTTIKNKTKNNLKDITVVLTIPKEVANDASLITSETPYTVLVKDPVIAFKLSDLNAGSSSNITYTVTSNELVDVNKISFEDPFVEKATLPIKSATSNNKITKTETKVVTEETAQESIVDDSVITEENEEMDIIPLEEDTSSKWYLLLIFGVVIVLGVILYFVFSRR